jgi:hypothetical protein
LIVPSRRSVVEKGELLALRITALTPLPCPSVSVRVRPIGRGEWKTIEAKHVARGVFQARRSPGAEDFEYYVDAGGELVWPAAAPQLSQTVVVME